LYIYTDNATAQDVYFDSLVITHTNGPLLEENHYYPFGLTMSALSSKALQGARYATNLQRFQNQLLEDNLDLNLYQFKWRTQDPQIGRFWQTDPLATDYVDNSPYAFSENHVTGHVELEGLERFDIKNGNNKPTVIYGPFPNTAVAQRYYDIYKTTGITYKLGDNIVQSPRIIQHIVPEIAHGANE
jgi:RHS repeat-associated protein